MRKQKCWHPLLIGETDISENISPTALIDPSAQLGNNVRVGPYSIIEKNVTIGKDTWVDAHVHIKPFARIGKECKIFHGAGMQMKNNGTGIYYKPGFTLTKNLQIISDLGLHFDSPARVIGSYGSSYKYRSIFMELLTGYRKELFNASIVGIFRPLLTLQAGSSVELNKLSLNNTGHWVFIYVIGTGVQFYNGRILNEMLLKVNQLISKERNISFQLSIYWK